MKEYVVAIAEEGPSLSVWRGKASTRLVALKQACLRYDVVVWDKIKRKRTIEDAHDALGHGGLVAHVEEL